MRAGSGQRHPRASPAADALLDAASAALAAGTATLSPLARDDSERTMPPCVQPGSRVRELTIRAPQELGIGSDPHTPYEQCPAG